jgi:hypothetical protein
MKNFVVRPHPDLGRRGPVCPFVPGSIERRTLWFAPERIADRGVPHVVELLNRYKSQLSNTEPTDSDDTDYRVIVVVFTDLAAESARGIFADALQEIAASSFAEDGIIFGPFYQGNDGAAIYNADFHPFQSSVPFVFVRHVVVSDWKFFLDDQEMVSHWARRFGASAVPALAEELRRLPWNARQD